MGAILGVKMAGHDTGAAVLYDGKVVAIAQERLDRMKHSSAFPIDAINYCLRELSIEPRDVTLVISDRSLDGKFGREKSESFFHSHSNDRFTHVRFEECNHHDAHAASAFFCSPFEDAAVLVYDGAGDRLDTQFGITAVETETLYRGTGVSLVQISKTMHEKHKQTLGKTCGIGLLYTRLSRDYLSFGANNEGKMMGLAAYGDASLLAQFPMERWMQVLNGTPICSAAIHFKTSIAKKARRRAIVEVPAWFFRGIRFHGSRILNAIAYRLSVRLAGTSAPSSHLFTPVRLPRSARDPATQTLPDAYYASVAYAGQQIFEQFALELGNMLRSITHSDNLCVAGGCALNIDANRNFLTQCGFKDLYVQPASSDCGIPLGCALWGAHVIEKQPRSWVMQSASLGKTYTDDDIQKAIGQYTDITTRKMSDVAEETAALLASGKIVGWFQGGSEYGPRALGNRSIICDAGRSDMRDVLNARVKHREMWRPFAASILAERLTDWFDIKPSVATGFMLLAAPIQNHLRSRVPAVVHVDGTCRMQTLTQADNGVYYDMVKAFEQRTGIPLVLNTSFNLGGDPIVESPEDAIDTFLRCDMDNLVIGSYVVSKH